MSRGSPGRGRSTHRGEELLCPEPPSAALLVRSRYYAPRSRPDERPHILFHQTSAPGRQPDLTDSAVRAAATVLATSCHASCRSRLRGLSRPHRPCSRQADAPAAPVQGLLDEHSRHHNDAATASNLLGGLRQIQLLKKGKPVGACALGVRQRREVRRTTNSIRLRMLGGSQVSQRSVSLLTVSPSCPHSTSPAATSRISAPRSTFP